MKKKITKKKKPAKQKIDVVIESLVNLEQRTKELINRIEQLERIVCRIYDSPKTKDQNKYWPNTNPPYKYNGIMWNKNAN